MSQKSAIIIGASSGIGNALARVLSSKGYRLGLVGRRRNLLEELQRHLPQPSIVKDFDLAQIDVARTELNELFVEMKTVDVVVISAGLGFHNYDLDWDKERLVLDVNVIGFAAMANEAFRFFKLQGDGQLIGISSLLALRGSGAAPAYGASKAFCSAYLSNLRRRAEQLNLSMTITDIQAGYIDTPMTSGSRMRFWMASAEKAATQIHQAIFLKKEHAYVTRRWIFVAWLMKYLPDFVFRKF